MAASRGIAQRAIADDRVRVGGMPATKAATLVGPGDSIELLGDEIEWAGRGGKKLAGVLGVFGVNPDGTRCLDVGASTGGFTDVLLHHGAAAVTAVDVGYGQMITRLTNDTRVTVVDRTNFRTLDVATLDPPFGLVVVDVSFISVTLLAANLAAAGAAGTDYVVLVKPQFEAGRGAVTKGGLVLDRGERLDAAHRVALALSAEGIGFLAAAPSPIHGASGNREIFVHGRLGVLNGPDRSAIDEAVGT